MAWVLVLLAGAAEIVFAASLGASEGFSRLLPSIVVILSGSGAVLLLSTALRDIPLSSGYVAFTAIGAVGAVAVGVVWRDEQLNAAQAIALALVIAGVIGLQASSGSAS